MLPCRTSALTTVGTSNGHTPSPLFITHSSVEHLRTCAVMPSGGGVAASVKGEGRPATFGLWAEARALS